MFLYLLGKYLELELADSMVKYIFNFVRYCENIPKGPYHFAAPPEMCEFELLCILIHTWCCQSFNLIHFS